MTIQAQDTLLVPMGLKALVMPEQNGSQAWDRRTLVYNNLNEYNSPLPPPFDNVGNAETGELPETGVHLYWTLPHALTKALTQQEIETAAANGGSVSESGYPFIPNRWLVVRIPDTGNAAAWVVNSDEMDSSNGQTPYVNPFDLAGNNVVNPVNIGIKKALADWAAEQGEKNSQPPYLTVIAPGNANFSAFTPGNRNVFSFYDDLDGLQDQAHLTYAVLGWYSNPAADPINPANSVNGGSVEWVPLEQTDLSVVSRLGWAAPLGGNPAPTRTITHSAIGDVQWDKSKPLAGFQGNLEQVKVALANSSAEGLAAIAYETMLDVGKDKSEAAQRAMELEAMQYGSLHYLDEPGGWHLLADRIKRASFQTVDGGYVWEAVAREKQAGDSTQHAALDDAAASALASLNRQQRAYDEACAVLKSMQLRLYSLWWQQQSIKSAAPPPTYHSGQLSSYGRAFLNAQNCLQVTGEKTLSQPVADYQTQVQAQIGKVEDMAKKLPPIAEGANEQLTVYAANFLDTDKFALKAVPRQRFFSPTDPVLVIAGAGRLSDPQPEFVICRIGSDIPQGADSILDAQAVQALPVAASALIDEVAAASAGTPTFTTWQQPWAPLYLDWSLKYYYTYQPGKVAENIKIDDQLDYVPNQAAWRFDGRKYHWVGGTIGSAGGSLQSCFSMNYTGRTFLTPHAAHNFKAQIKKLAESQGIDLPSEELDKIGDWSLLSQSVSGLTQLLAMRDNRSNVAPGTDIAAAVGPQTDGVPAPCFNLTPLLQGEATGTPYFFPMRAGFWAIADLQLIDSFGRIMTLMYANNGDGTNGLNLLPILPPSLRPSEGTDSSQSPCGLAVAPPRIVQPSRLAFRYVDANDDSAEIDLTANGNPVCGWLLTNHSDRSVAVYDQDGHALGALQPFVVSSGDNILQWVPAPGGNTAPAQAVTIPNIANPHLSALVSSLLTRDDGAQALVDLSMIIDQAAWSLDPGDDQSDPGTCALAGYPVAVVRSNLQLQLKGLANCDQSYENIFQGQTDTLLFDNGGVTKLSFEFKLGAHELRQDGVAGYYLGSDYSQLKAVHLPEETTTDYASQQGDGGYPSLSPVETPSDSDGSMNTDGSLYATLLVDPRGSIHVTSGILPRLRHSLPDRVVDAALRNMRLSIQTGPVLVNTEAVRLPIPSGAKGKWWWLTAHSPQAGAWRRDPLSLADGSARPMPQAPVLQEGWMILKPQENSPNK